jgi:hypothetical protein
VKKKYEVKAGKEFVVVVVEQESKSAFSWSTVAAMGLSVLVLSFVIPAAYGAVSGDYSALRTVAEYVKDIVEVVASHAGT